MILRGLALASVLAIPAFAQSTVDSADAKASESWSVNGSVGAEFGYHSVVTGKNETDSVFFSGNDSIYPGQKYRNYFGAFLSSSSRWAIYFAAPPGRYPVRANSLPDASVRTTVGTPSILYVCISWRFCFFTSSGWDLYRGKSA